MHEAKPKYDRITINFPPNTGRKLRAIAAKNKRTVVSETVIAVETHIQKSK